MHYFASYECRRRPGRSSESLGLPTQSFSIPFKNGQKSFLGRVDDQLSPNNRLSVRGSRWDWENPVVLAAGGHPSASSDQTKDATNVLGTWSRVMAGGNRILEVKGGYNGFHWTNATRKVGRASARAGADLRRALQLPADAQQNNWTGRVDLGAPEATRSQGRRRDTSRRRSLGHCGRGFFVQQRADQPRGGARRTPRGTSKWNLRPHNRWRATSGQLHPGRLDD